VGSLHEPYEILPAIGVGTTDQDGFNGVHKKRYQSILTPQVLKKQHEPGNDPIYVAIIRDLRGAGSPRRRMTTGVLHPMHPLAVVNAATGGE